MAATALPQIVMFGAGTCMPTWAGLLARAGRTGAFPMAASLRLGWLWMSRGGVGNRAIGGNGPECVFQVLSRMMCGMQSQKAMQAFGRCCEVHHGSKFQAQDVRTCPVDVILAVVRHLVIHHLA